MKKDLLLRHISGEVSPQEEREVLDWVSACPGNKKYYMDLKNLWISRTIPPTKASASELAAIRNRTTRGIETRYTRRGIFMYLYGSVAAAAVIALAVTLFTREHRPDMNVNELVRVQLADIPRAYRHEVYTEKGVKAKVILPDSSQVWLNSESRIIYPDKFIGSTREIEFSGEAFFDVKKNPSLPMMIKTNKDFIVRVLGTSFNLKSYENDESATTTLYTGIIDIISGKPGTSQVKTTRVNPNQICVVKKNDVPVLSQVGEANARKEYAWKEGRLIFEGTSMGDVVKMLRRWHGVDIIVEDPAILDYKITANFDSESIVQIAEMLRYCALIDFKVSGNKVYFRKR